MPPRRAPHRPTSCRAPATAARLGQPPEQSVGAFDVCTLRVDRAIELLPETLELRVVEPVLDHAGYPGRDRRSARGPLDPARRLLRDADGDASGAHNIC